MLQQSSLCFLNPASNLVQWIQIFYELVFEFKQRTFDTWYAGIQCRMDLHNDIILIVYDVFIFIKTK